MGHRDFRMLQRYLKTLGVKKQKELADFLEVNESTISEMKRKGFISEENIFQIAFKVAEKLNKNPEDLYEEILENAYEYDFEKEKNFSISGRDFCLPSKEKCKEVLSLDEGAKDYFSNVIAIKKSEIKRFQKKGEIITIKYYKNNLYPNISQNDTLVVVECSKYIGEGIYIYKEQNNITACHLQPDPEYPDKCIVKIFLENELRGVDPVNFPGYEMVGKVIFVFREMV